MTGNLILDSAISVGAIALMVLAARLAFGAPVTPVEESTAQARLSFDEPDFAPVDWLIDDGGGAALAKGRAGDFALVFRHGADLVTRRFGAGAATTKADGTALTITQTDPGSRAVTLRSEDAARWARIVSGA